MQLADGDLSNEWSEQLQTAFPWLQEFGLASRPALAFLVLVAGFLMALVGRALATRITKRVARQVAVWSNSPTPEPPGSYASAVGAVVYWTPLLLAAALISELLGLHIVTRWLSQIVEYLPRLISAVLIVVFGLLVAKAAGQIVARTATTAGLPAAHRLRRAAEVSIGLASCVVAVEQLGLEIAFLKTFVLVVLAAILGGAALAIGLGSRDIVANVLSIHYLQKVYQVGQVIRFEGVEGRIVRVTQLALIVDDGDGEGRNTRPAVDEIPVETRAQAGGPMSVATMELVEAFVRAYPATAARRAEVADPRETAELLSVLKPETSVALLAKLIPLAAAPALAAMPPAEAAQLAERLGPQRSARLLRRMEKASASALIAELPTESQTVVRRLLDYRTDQAASRMDPRAPAVSAQTTAQQTLDLVRRSPGSALNFIYVVDEQQRLTGVVSMRELMLATPETAVEDIMTRSPQRLHADDPLQSVLVHPGWRSNHALPVVDANDQFVGVVRYSAFRAIEAELGHAQSGPVAERTSEALAELLWLGASSIGRMTQAAVLGPAAEDDSI